MNTGMTAANSSANLEKTNQYPAVLRFFANAISILFHPVFIPLLLVWFLIYEHPYQFAGFTPKDKLLVMIQAFAMFTFFPLITVLLLKGLNFIDSLYLKTQKDRIIPLIACGIWYFWIWYVWRNLPDYPQPAIQLALAVWITSWVGLMVNIKMKISLHGMAVGVLLAFITLLAFSQAINFGVYLSFSFLIAGLVATARFIVSDHSTAEVYGGIVVGMLSMLVASWVA